MGILWTIIIICMINGFGVLVSNRKFGECIPFTFLGIPLVFYFSQFMFSTFYYAYVFIYLFAGMFVAGLVFNINHSRERVKQKYFSKGLLTFIIILFIVLIIDFNRYFSTWDELSHWGMMTKELLRLDGWYAPQKSRLLVHWEYPPFLSLFEMFWCKTGGGYKEATVNIALHSFLLAIVILPVSEVVPLNNENNKTKKNNIFIDIINILMLCIITILVIKLFDAYNVFTTIYKDIALPLMFIYGIILIFCYEVYESIFDFSCLVLCNSALLLTKQMGIAFVLLIWLSFIGYYSIKKNSLSKKVIIPYLMRVLCLIVVPILIYSLWKNYTVSQGLIGQFELSQIKIYDIFEMIKDRNCSSVRRQTFNMFVHALCETNVTSSTFALSYLSIYLLVIFAIILGYKSKMKLWTRSKAIMLTVVYTCGTFGYAFTMGILYLFCFSESEMLALASYSRYMSSYVLGEVLSLCFITYISLKTARNKKIYSSVLLIICILIGGSNLSVFIPGCIEGSGKNIQYRQIGEFLEENIDDETRCFVLADDTGMSQFFINYYCEDITIPQWYTNILQSDMSDKNVRDNFMYNLILADDYLYVKDVTEEVSDDIFMITGKTLEANTLYKVDKSNESITIEKVDTNTNYY